MKTILKFLYNERVRDILHSIGAGLISADCLFLFTDAKSFPDYEPLVFSLGVGLFIGLSLCVLWEKLLQETIMKVPASKKDMINMTGCATLLGPLVYLILDSGRLLLIPSIIMVVIIIWQLREYFLIKKRVAKWEK